MAKKLAIRNFVCMTILSILLIVLCFINVGIPTTTSGFVGFANAIVKDIDLGGGYSSDYTVSYNDENVDQEQEFNRTISMITGKLSQFGYGTSRVFANKDGITHIELPNIKSASSILEAISLEGKLTVRSGETASEKDITAEYIRDAYATFGQTSYSAYSWGTTISFTDEGKDKIKELTSSGSGTIYIYVGDEKVSAFQYSSEINYSDVYFYGGDNTQDSANVTVLKILMGKYGADFDMVNNQINILDPSISENVLLLIGLAVVFLILLMMVCMFYAFGEFGWIINLTFTFFASTTIFFMQALPIFFLSISGIIGAVLGMVLFFISNLIIFSAIKKGYAEGKKIPLATRLGFHNSVLKIVDMNVLSIIGAVFIYFIGGVYAQSFALSITICASLNMFFSLLMNRWFSKWYLKINSKNAKKLNFKSEVQINEI